MSDSLAMPPGLLSFLEGEIFLSKNVEQGCRGVEGLFMHYINCVRVIVDLEESYTARLLIAQAVPLVKVISLIILIILSSFSST